MKNFKWNIWTILLAIVAGIIGLRVLAWLFKLLWVVGGVVISLLVWVAFALALVFIIRFIVNKLRGR